MGFSFIGLHGAALGAGRDRPAGRPLAAAGPRAGESGRGQRMRGAAKRRLLWISPACHGACSETTAAPHEKLCARLREFELRRSPTWSSSAWTTATGNRRRSSPGSGRAAAVQVVRAAIPATAASRPVPRPGGPPPAGRDRPNRPAPRTPHVPARPWADGRRWRSSPAGRATTGCTQTPGSAHTSDSGQQSWPRLRVPWSSPEPSRNGRSGPS